MTRALITDPDLPAKARSGRLEELVRCIGCNACIAHYHGGTPIRVRGQPGHRPRAASRTHGCDGAAEAARGRRRRPRRPRGGGRRRPVGPRGRAARALGAARRPDRARRRGAGGCDARRDISRQRRPAAHAGGRRARPRGRRDGGHVLELEPDAVVVATGARPYLDAALSLRRREPTGAWDVLEAGCRPASSVLVADWGGDQSGLDAAEVLAAAGKQVTLAVASLAPAELVHQYRRNLYLQRLYRAGVTILHHLELESVDRRYCSGCATCSRPSCSRPCRQTPSCSPSAGSPRSRWRRSSAAQRHRGPRGGRLPLAALARGGCPRGHARSARGLRVGSARP